MALTGGPLRHGLTMMVCFICGMVLTWIALTGNYFKPTSSSSFIDRQIPGISQQTVETQRLFQQEDPTVADTALPAVQKTVVPSPDEQQNLAKKLENEVKIMCVVATHEANHRKKCDHVMNTWGKRCNKIVFMSNAPDEKLPLLHYDVSSEKRTLSLRHFFAFNDVYKQYYNDYDWFLKADDDTYVVLENLRYFLSEKNKSEPVYYGHVFKTNVPQGYPSGGGGYVLSKEAMRRFGTLNGNKCELYESGADDVVFGKCMENLGIKLADSRDRFGRSRFHCFGAGTFIHGYYPDWYLSYDKYGAPKGTASMSDYAITFHYITPEQLYEYDYFIYHLRPYGLHTTFEAANGPVQEYTTTTTTTTSTTTTTIAPTTPTTTTTTGIPPTTIPVKAAPSR